MREQGRIELGLLRGLVGVCGVIYAFFVVGRMRRQRDYRPEPSDWCFYLLLPMAAYVALGGSAFVATSHDHAWMFAVGGAALVLLFVGIHNSWDSVAYHALVRRRRQESQR